jgi:hypothetical protein
MPFQYEIREHKKDKHRFIEITGFEGSVTDLVIPEELEGIPETEGLKVEAVGNHSFSGRQDLVSVSLPESIKTIYGFAFHNCRKLKKISLYDSIDDYYDGVCRQCDSLSDIDITINREWFEVIRNFLADSDRTLRFLVRAGTEKSCLTFPEYTYDFNENTMARTIQFSIAGSGMFYRECVDRRSINYREYDKLFEKARIDGGEIAEDIAIGRLLFPVSLEDGPRLKYEQYVRDNGKSVLERFVRGDGTKGAGNGGDDRQALDTLRDLLKYSADRELFYEKDIESALSLSAELGLTECSAVIMESGRKAQNDNKTRFEF